MDQKAIMGRFLVKLMNLDMWGGKHTELTNLKKCIPKHLRGEKVTEKALRELVKEGFIMQKISTSEIHVSLNPEKKKNIYEFLKN